MTTTSAQPIVGALDRTLGTSLIGLLNSWRNQMPEVEAALSTSDDALFVAASVDGTVVGGYVLRRSDMSFEMIGLAINPAFRKRGIGKMCCMDALFRAGKSPLVLTANAESEAFAKTVGFKLVGKRKQPDGTFLIRMGWHAPRPGADPNDPLAC